MSTSNILKYGLITLMVISAIFVAFFYFGGTIENTDEPIITNLILNWSYLLVGVAALCAILFPVYSLVQNPESLKFVLLVIGLFVVVFGLSYILASDEPIVIAPVNYDDASQLKNVGMGLIATYILIGAAVGSIIYSEVSQLFK